MLSQVSKQASKYVRACAYLVDVCESRVIEVVADGREEEGEEVEGTEEAC